MVIYIEDHMRRRLRQPARVRPRLVAVGGAAAAVTATIEAAARPCAATLALPTAASEPTSPTVADLAGLYAAATLI